MKKRLFLIALMISLFACVLAISVNAVTGSTSNEFGEVTYIDGLNANTTITDKDSRVVLLNANGTYTTYPTYYISDLKLQWQGTTQYSFDNINSATGESYSMKSIVRIEILNDATIWYDNSGSLQGNTNLVEVHFTSGTQITEIGGQVFKGCTNLKTINIPASCTKLGWLCFEGCTGLENVIFDERTTNISFTSPTFTECTSLKSFVFPSTVTVDSFPGNVFRNCTALEDVHFPQGFDTLKNNVFTAQSSSTKRLYVPITSNISAISSVVADATIITNGTREQVSSLGFGTIYSYDEFINAGKPSGKAVVYDCCSSLVYTSKHNVVAVNPCVNACTGCDAKEQNPNPTHAFDSGKIAYANGYASNGTYTVTCQNAGCACNTSPIVEMVNPIFELLGFSTDMDKTRIVLGYVFNNDSYSAYGKELSFGVVAYIPNGNTCAPLAISEGEVAPINPDYTIFVELTNIYNNIDFIISGIPQSKFTLAMCVYVYDGTSLSYLNCENGGLTQDSVAYAYEIENGSVTKKA